MRFKSLISVHLTLFILGSAILLNGCDLHEQKIPTKKQELVIYSGITMVRPLNVLAQEFAYKNGVTINIKQGASGYLYNALKKERNGDIYFPGSDSYRLKNQADGLLKDYVFVGYNRIALVVPKGNPKHLTNDLNQLANQLLSVVLSSPDSGAVGKNAKALLDRVGITDAVYNNVTYFTTDSHRIFTAIKRGEADLALNWYATTRWPETENYMDAILLPETLAKPKRLELNLLSFSKHPELAKAFMAYASSRHGLETFAQFGFFTNEELTKALADLDAPVATYPKSQP